MKNNDFGKHLHDAVENYYLYNPDTLMPLVIAALAVQGKLSIENVTDDDINPSDDATDTTVHFASIQFEEVLQYDWVRLDPKLKKKIRQCLDNNVKAIRVVGNIDDSLRDIYDTFHHYDTYTVEEEYHHRIGILYHHSDNEASEQAHRQYATICLAEALLCNSVEWLKDLFLVIGNHMLVKSGLQPERPRMNVALALNVLMDYDGAGTIYNPFAGCGIAAAMIEGEKQLWADGNGNDKLFAVARLLNYGMGGSNEHFEQHDSTLWREGKFDYILSTYMGYVNGKSAFDFCLSKCADSLTEQGRFVGMVSPKDIFEHQSDEMKEVMKNDWLDTIVLLPFGEVAVLINRNKPKIQKKVVRFFNLNHPMLSQRFIPSLLSDDNYAEYFDLSDVRKKGFFRELLIHDLKEREGYEIVRLGDYVSKCRRQTYSLKNVPENERVLTYIDRKNAYNPLRNLWMNGLEKDPITSLFAPAYCLKEDCLITNDHGALDPRGFDSDWGTSYFQGGYAFSFNDTGDAEWIVEELNKRYVLQQLHPYGLNRMVPQSITEEQILNLQIYRENFLENLDLDDDEQNTSEPDEKFDCLPEGFVLHYDNVDYTLVKFLDNGFFGYTYRAEAYNRATGQTADVVLKEFYPHLHMKREGVRAVLRDEDDQRFIDDNLPKFFEECNIMKKLGNIEDSHIVPALESFKCEETDSYFYVMPLYEMSLLEMAQSWCDFNEEICVEHILKPICKALYLAHREGVLHLDIKPDNILLDKEGNAALIDFGVAKRYDEKGRIIDACGSGSKSCFAAPEMLVEGNMVTFGPQPDIYGLAATVYYLITNGQIPHPVEEFSDQYRDLRHYMKQENCSPQFIDAIVCALSRSASARPKDALAFLRMFPNCEQIKF